MNSERNWKYNSKIILKRIYDNRLIDCDPLKVTQLTNVTTQYGMTSTQNAYMWMCGFAGEDKGSRMKIF